MLSTINHAGDVGNRNTWYAGQIDAHRITAVYTPVSAILVARNTISPASRAGSATARTDDNLADTRRRNIEDVGLILAGQRAMQWQNDEA